MSSSTKSRSREISRWLLFSAIAGLAGALINTFRISVFGGAYLFFGGVLPLALALRFGAFTGLFASAVASIPIVLYYHHPWDLVAYALEAGTLGWLARRRIPPLVLDAMYWCLLGGPLVVLVRHFNLGFTTVPLWAIILTLLLNGLLNVTLAEMLLSFGPLVRGLGIHVNRGQPLRAHLSRGILLAVAVPFVLLNIITDQIYSKRLEADGLARLGVVAVDITRDVNQYLEKHLTAAIAIASVIERDGLLDPGRLEHFFRAQHAFYPGFQTLGLIDASGFLLASDPSRTPTGQSVVELRHSLADRQYFKEAVVTGRPYVSDVFLGRLVSNEPIVTIAVPVKEPRGRIAAVLSASLKLARFQEVFTPEHLPLDAGAVMLDQDNRVIFASPGLPYRSLETPDDPSLLFALGQVRGGHAFSFERPGPTPRPRFLAAAGRTTTGWTIMIEQPLVSVTTQSGNYYLWTGLWVLAGLALTVVAAGLLASKVTEPLDQLVKRVRLFAVEPGAPPPQSPPSAGAPLEIGQLFHDFDEMSSRLRESYSQLQVALGDGERLNREMQSLLLDLDRKVKERTAELAKATQKAEAASSLKSQFLANMSHEIRTPMNGVMGMLDLVLESELNAEQQEYLEIARGSADTLLVILNDILDFSKIEAGRMDLDPTRLSPAALVAECTHTLRLAAQRKGLALEWEVSPDLPQVAIGDVVRLRQVLLNLVNNAIKFTESGWVRLGLRVVEANPDSLLLHFSVRDTGIGMTESQQQVVFDAFRQADGSTTRKYGGTGLGLAICTRLVGLMQGRIWVESRPGQGSTFHFTARLGQDLPDEIGSLEPSVEVVSG